METAASLTSSSFKPTHPTRQAGRKKCQDNLESTYDRVSSRPTQQGRPEVASPAPATSASRWRSFKPTHPTRQAGSSVEPSGRDARMGDRCFKPTHPTRQAGSPKSSYRRAGCVRREFQADPPNKAGRKTSPTPPRRVPRPTPRFQADPPNKAGRKCCPRVQRERFGDSTSTGFQADPPNKAGRKPSRRASSRRGTRRSFQADPPNKAGRKCDQERGNAGDGSSSFKPTHPTRQAGSS